MLRNSESTRACLHIPNCTCHQWAIRCLVLVCLRFHTGEPGLIPDPCGHTLFFFSLPPLSIFLFVSGSFSSPLSRHTQTPRVLGLTVLTLTLSTATNDNSSDLNHTRIYEQKMNTFLYTTKLLFHQSPTRHSWQHNDWVIFFQTQCWVQPFYFQTLCTLHMPA